MFFQNVTHLPFTSHTILLGFLYGFAVGNPCFNPAHLNIITNRCKCDKNGLVATAIFLTFATFTTHRRHRRRHKKATDIDDNDDSDDITDNWFRFPIVWFCMGYKPIANRQKPVPNLPQLQHFANHRHIAPAHPLSNPSFAFAVFAVFGILLRT
jgi:hypothetical protein